jgi:hydrogenase maturation factor
MTNRPTFVVDQADLSCVPGPDGHCAICADEGLPGRVLAVYPEQSLALVACDAATLEVATDLLDAVAVGDTLLVHVGVAIARIDARP